LSHHLIYRQVERRQANAPIVLQPGRVNMAGMIRQFARLFVLASLATIMGCSSSDNYDVIVTNRLPDTVTLWLTRTTEP
jgi:hypothetical protein